MYETPHVFEKPSRTHSLGQQPARGQQQRRDALAASLRIFWAKNTSPTENQADEMAVCQNLVPLVNIKIAGKWMFIPLNMVLIDIDPYPNVKGG